VGRALDRLTKYDLFTRALLPVFEKRAGKEGIWNEGTHYNQIALKPTFIWMSAAGTALGKEFFNLGDVARRLRAPRPD